MAGPSSEVVVHDPPNATWITEPCMLGIDEAGRGPVLGPMVYACAYCPVAYATELKTKSYADSKVLSEAQREMLLGRIREDPLMGHSSESLSAAFISGAMLSRERTSLNAIAYASTARLIRAALDRGVNLVEAYIDTVGDADRYKARLSGDFPGVAFTVCSKADALFPVVSAASIVAKVTRDRHVRNLSVPAALGLTREFGSGYPADPDTKAWLECSTHPVFGFPDVVRFSWATCAPLLEAARAVRVQWECEAEDDPAQLRLSFVRDVRPASKPAPPRHPFYRARRLTRVYDAFLGPPVAT